MNEVRKIENYLQITEANDTDDLQLFSEHELALLYTKRHEVDSLYCPQLGHWLHYAEGHWQEDSTLKAVDRVRAVCTDPDLLAPKKQLRQLQSARTVQSVEKLARADQRTVAVPEQFDADGWILNTPTGVIDLHTGASRRHRREDYCRKITAVDPGGDCPIWLQFIDRITDHDADLAGFLQRMTGYCLTGSTEEECLFFLFGSGANGKSRFLAAVTGMLNSYARTAPMETFTASNSDRHPTEVAGLQGARLVTAFETEEGRRWAESKIKALTGSDTVAARFMRQDFFQYCPQFKLVLAGNYKPSLRSVNEAARRRFHLIPFRVTIPEPERDKHLGAKLQHEWSGILQWAIEGCLQWQRAGLQPPAAVQNATNEYLLSEDRIGRFISECCQLGPRLYGKTKPLFAAYCRWSEENRERPLSSKEFNEELDRRDFTVQHTEYGNVRPGLALKDSDIDG
jgi:putative DNA primase/helicase